MKFRLTLLRTTFSNLHFQGFIEVGYAFCEGFRYRGRRRAPPESWRLGRRTGKNIAPMSTPDPTPEKPHCPPHRRFVRFSAGTASTVR